MLRPVERFLSGTSAVSAGGLRFCILSKTDDQEWVDLGFQTISVKQVVHPYMTFGVETASEKFVTLFKPQVT